jgi:hypothetical protein
MRGRLKGIRVEGLSLTQGIGWLACRVIRLEFIVLGGVRVCMQILAYLGEWEV